MTKEKPSKVAAMAEEKCFLTFKATDSKKPTCTEVRVIGEVARTIKVVSISKSGKLIMHVQDAWISGSGHPNGKIMIHGDWGVPGSESRTILELLTSTDGTLQLSKATDDPLQLSMATDGSPPPYSEPDTDARMARRTGMVIKNGLVEFVRKDTGGISLLTEIIHTQTGESHFRFYMWLPGTTAMASLAAPAHRAYFSAAQKFSRWEFNSRKLPGQTARATPTATTPTATAPTATTPTATTPTATTPTATTPTATTPTATTPSATTPNATTPNTATPSVFRRMAGVIKALGRTGTPKQRKENEATSPDVKG